MKLTQEQLDAVLARNPSLAKLNKDSRWTGTLYMRQIAEGIKRPALSVTKIEGTQRPLLNKTESLWKAELERRGHKIILAQAITLKLGDRLTYRPDLVTVGIDPYGIPSGAISLTCYETKSLHRFARTGINKVKMAAKLFPYVRFVLVTRNKGDWTEKEIKSE